MAPRIKARCNPLSITTRIETAIDKAAGAEREVATHYPLQQGLKPWPATLARRGGGVATHYPLQQGLKLE